MLVQDLPFSGAVDWINDFMFRREILRDSPRIYAECGRNAR
jgi:hypothetical protein